MAPDSDQTPASPHPPTLRQMTVESHMLLLRIETVFPFTLFPSSITIDLHKVSVVKRGFMRVKQIITANHEDILSIESDMGPVFAALIITTRFFTPEPLTINFLRKRDASRARRLINGLLITHKGGIIIDEPNPVKAREKLIKLGEAHE